MATARGATEPTRDTRTRKAPAAVDDDREKLRDELRASGLRATASRIAVLRLLRRSGGPVSHSDVDTSLDGQGWDRVTLYRNLLDLTKAGLARRTDLGDHVWRFEATTEGHQSFEHPHFVCDTCGTVQCLDGAVLTVKRGARSPKSVRTQKVQVQVLGLCDSCG